MANRTCSAPECERPVEKREWCNRHYRMKLRSGEIKVQRAPRGLTLAEHLQHIGWDVTDTNCWEWRGAKSPAGYGVLRHAGPTVSATRSVWSLANGPVPDGMVVRHKCDNPPCVNPDHLEIGTPAQNSRDMVERNRSSAYATGRYDGVCAKGKHDISKPEALRPASRKSRKPEMICVECDRERKRKWEAKQRAA